VKQVHLAQEFHDEPRRRVVEHFLRSARLLDPRLVHHHDPVRHLEGFVLIVRHQHAGNVQFVVQPPQPAPQLLRTFASSAPNGSSSSSTLGSMASARASATRCRWPPESCEGIALRQPVELDQRQQLVNPIPISAGEGRSFRGRTRRPKAMFSNTSCAEQRVVLEHEAHAAGPWRALPRDVFARNNHGAPLGGVRDSSPAMIRSSVVFPEPEGPSSATSSPSPTFRDTRAARRSCRTSC
jgi:hypothetical protein